MKVIFIKDVPRVGKRHDVKEINDGYALNFLFPNSLAKIATAASLLELEKNKKQISLKKEIQTNLLNKNLTELAGKLITIQTKADEKGSLFSAIYKKDIKKQLEKEHRIEIDEDFIFLEKVIKKIGDFKIPIIVNKKEIFINLSVEKE